MFAEDYLQPYWVFQAEQVRPNKYNNNNAARQTRTDDPLVNSQLSFRAQYCALNLLYHAELERRNNTANPRTK